jgi:hypothetical protein
MNSELPVSNEQITSFVDLLKNNLPEHRDNQHKAILKFSVIDTGCGIATHQKNQLQ